MKEIARSTIARLLATENITVVQDNVKTASFDVKNRVLRLPSWSDVEPYTEDHLIGHEVGHAIYTPLDGWHSAVCSKGPSYKSYLNVVEDARIEKLVQRKYPGLRTAFVKSYRKMLKDGFFGGQLDDINKMSLIDRINVYFKCGQSIGVKFAEDETQWLPRIDAAETWDDVVAIVDELYAGELEKHQQRQEEQEEEQMMDDESGAESSDWDMDMDGEEGDDSWSGDADEFGDDEEDYESDESQQMSAQEGGMEGSQTDKTLRENIANEIMDKEYSEVYHLLVDMPKKYDDYIIDFKTVLAQLKHEANLTNDHYREERAQNIGHTVGPALVEHFGTMCYNDWSAVNKKAVNHMVKEFEMRKSAAEYARASIAKTGVIDTVKMNNYKLTDDIFKKVTILPEGKNHGFIMYLDMSGSMGDYMYETVEQTLLLAHFAKQINVPFRVYGFTSTVTRWSKQESPDATHHNGYNGLVSPIGVRLIELFSDKMSRGEMTFMSKALLANYLPMQNKNKKWDFAKKHDVPFRDVNWILTDPLLQLGGTPLNHALVVGIPLARDFRAAHRIDVLNTILLTDGASHELESFGTDTWAFRYSSDKKLITYTCLINNKTYKVRNYANRNGMQTDALMEMYKDVTGSSLIGYRIESNRTRDLVHCYSTLKGTRLGYDAEKDFAREYRAEGWVKVDNAIGYDECFILNSKNLGIEDNKMETLDADASKAKIRNAFKKSSGNTKKSRRMLTDLCERVA